MNILAIQVLVALGVCGASDCTAPASLFNGWGETRASMVGAAPCVRAQSPVEPSLPGEDAFRVLTPADGIDRVLDGGEFIGPAPQGTAIERLPEVGDAFPLETITSEDVLSSYYDPFSRQLAYGLGRYQPYRFGWYSYDDFTYLPTAPVRGTTGSFQDLEWNGSVRYSRPVNDRSIFAFTPAWNTRWLTGPSGIALPPHVDQFAFDFQWSSAVAGPWNWQVGVTPQINSDFNRSLDSNAYIVDSRAVLLYQPSVYWRFGLGAELWDRVHEEAIPYGGVDWTPNDVWEFRMFFPKTRISRYWGNVRGNHIWTYTSSEYNSQAYQVDISNTRAKDRMELRDDQLLAGVSAQHNTWTAFTEAGTVLARNARFRGPTQNFNIHNALMARVGIMY